MGHRLLLRYMLVLIISTKFGTVCAEDVSVWPYSVGMLANVFAFLGSLHWHFETRDLGVGGDSFLKPLIFYELWAWERLTCERAAQVHEWRPISVPTALAGSGIDMCKSCWCLWYVSHSLRDILWVLHGACLVILVLIVVGSGMLSGSGVVMA